MLLDLLLLLLLERDLDLDLDTNRLGLRLLLDFEELLLLDLLDFALPALDLLELLLLELFDELELFELADLLLDFLDLPLSSRMFGGMSARQFFPQSTPLMSSSVLSCR